MVMRLIVEDKGAGVMESLHAERNGRIRIRLSESRDL